MESSDSIDKSWDTSSDLTSTTTTALRSDPLASSDAPSSSPGGWMVNVTGRDILEMSQADVLAKRRDGELSGNTLVWREGMETWAKLESVPAFQLAPKASLDDDKDEPTSTHLVAVYERPMATLVFDEEVESEWKAPAKASEASKPARTSEKSAHSASARPLAPSFPAPASRPNPVVPADEPPPPPPLPPRRSLAPQHQPRLAQPTIPGGLEPPTPRSAPVSSAPVSSSPPASAAPKKTTSPVPSGPPASAARSSGIPAGAFRPSAPPATAAQPSARPAKSPAPPATTSSAPSPLLTAIAAAASSPAPPPAAPVVSSPLGPTAVASSLDEPSVVAALGAKTVSLRIAVLGCVGSALVASILTGLVVGSGGDDAARRSADSLAKTAQVVTAPVPAAPAPSPIPTPAAAPTVDAPASPPAESSGVEKVAASVVAEKPKPKLTKAYTWKPPKPSPPAADATGETASAGDRPAPNAERDDPERAVPDRATDSTETQPATLQDPGF
jgi:hypothetical protein